MGAGLESNLGWVISRVLCFWYRKQNNNRPDVRVLYWLYIRIDTQSKSGTENNERSCDIRESVHCLLYAANRVFVMLLFDADFIAVYQQENTLLLRFGELWKCEIYLQNCIR